MGRGNALAFGNNRRNPRMMYNGNLNITEANSLLNAQQYSLSGQNIPKPYSNNTNINASFGGPLKIPKLLSGTGGQFTVSVGIGRNRNGQQGSLTTMPSALERSGDFSQSVGSNGKPVVIYDPTTGAPFPGNKIGAARIDSIAAALLGYYPMPESAGPDAKLPAPHHALQQHQQPERALNQTLSPRTGFRAASAIPATTAHTRHLRLHRHRQRARHEREPLLLAQFRQPDHRHAELHVQPEPQPSSPFFAYKDNVAARLGIQGVSTDPLNWGPPNLNFTNFSGLSDAAASLARSQTSSVGASLMWVRGSHNLSFGSNFRRQQNNRYSDPNGRGSFTFNGYATSLIVGRRRGAGHRLRSGGFPAGNAGRRHRALWRLFALLPRLRRQPVHAG